MSFATRRTRDVAERQAAVELRRRVFCEEQGVSPADEVIGTCRLLLRGTICQLSRMAVDAGARGRGVGGALLRAAEAEARAADAQHIALHAQLHAQRLYASYGYVPYGVRFMEAGIEHVAMEKALALIGPHSALGHRVAGRGRRRA
ncbi:MAG: GNAT family N-acetyltransferase [Solirubrobacteraceae bacterium]